MARTTAPRSPTEKQAAGKKSESGKKSDTGKTAGAKKKAATPSGSRRARKRTATGSSPKTTAPRRRPERPEWPHDGTRGLFAPADTRRPHVRLGALWFVVAMLSFVGGPIGIAIPYGSAAALGAAQTARAWQRAGRHPNLAAAACLAPLLALLSAYATWGLGAAILIGVAVSVGLAAGDTRGILADGGTTVRSWLFPGLAAASVVVITQMDLGAGIALVLLTSAYDCGNYLMGSESRWPLIGVVAGGAAVGVLTFSLFVVALPPFGGSGVVLYGVATAVLAPLGQIVASYVLPDGRALASGLRRLDSVLLVGPAWLVLFATVPLD